MELKCHLTLLGTLADQTQQPSRQVSDEQEHFESLRASTARDMQAHAKPFILGVTKLLFDSHTLGVERDDGRRAEVGVPRDRGQSDLTL